MDSSKDNKGIIIENCLNEKCQRYVKTEFSNFDVSSFLIFYNSTILFNFLE